MSALFSFLGGSVFRMIWGEVSAFVTRQQDHKFELERIDRQEQIDSATHARNLAALQLQSDLGIKEVVVRAEAVADAGELDAWASVVQATSKSSGVAWIDGWNQGIRPMVASVAIIAMLLEIYILGHLTDWHYQVFSAALGIYLADRSLAKRGK